MTALAVDTRRWELVRFTFFDHPNPEMAGTRYEVLHMSVPHVGDAESG